MTVVFFLESFGFELSFAVLPHLLDKYTELTDGRRPFAELPTPSSGILILDEEGSIARSRLESTNLGIGLDHELSNRVNDQRTKI